MFNRELFSTDVCNMMKQLVTQTGIEYPAPKSKGQQAETAAYYGACDAYSHVVSCLDRVNKKLWNNRQHRYEIITKDSVISYLQNKAETAHYPTRNHPNCTAYCAGKRKAFEELIAILIDSAPR